MSWGCRTCRADNMPKCFPHVGFCYHNKTVLHFGRKAFVLCLWRVQQSFVFVYIGPISHHPYDLSGGLLMQISTLIHHGQDIHGLLRFRTRMDFRGAWMEHTLSKSDFHIVHVVSIFSVSVNKWCIIRCIAVLRSILKRSTLSCLNESGGR